MNNIVAFEFRKSLRGVLIWCAVTSFLCIILLAFFETIKERADAINSLTDTLPPELLKSFGTSSFTDIEGYFNGRFLFLFIIMNSVWGASSLAGITGKELNNSNIVLLFTRRVSKLKVFTSKIAAFLINMFLINFVTFLVTIASIKIFTTEENLSIQFFAASFVGAFVVQLVFSSIGLLIGVIKSESAALFSVLGLTIGGFIIDTIARIDGGPEFLKYFTPYYYLDLENISVADALRPERMIALLVFTIVVAVISYRIFKRKEIQI
jgi:ABC-2 type transport system permease protein